MANCLSNSTISDDIEWPWWPVRTTSVYGPCSRAVNMANEDRRHFWTPVNTARVSTCDTLVTGTAREHGCHFVDIPVHGPCSRVANTGVQNDARVHGDVYRTFRSLTYRKPFHVPFFSYSCAAFNKISAEIGRRAVALRQVGLFSVCGSVQQPKP